MPTDTAPKPSIATPPATHRGRTGKRLDDAYVQSVAKALEGLEDGQVVATGERYSDKQKARKAVELVRRELTRITSIPRARIGTRIWEDGDAWVGGVHNRDADS